MSIRNLIGKTKVKFSLLIVFLLDTEPVIKKKRKFFKLLTIFCCVSIERYTLQLPFNWTQFM